MRNEAKWGGCVGVRRKGRGKLGLRVGRGIEVLASGFAFWGGASLVGTWITGEGRAGWGGLQEHLLLSLGRLEAVGY